MNPLTDLGVATAGLHLEKRIAREEVRTPLHLPDGSALFVWQGRADAVDLVTWMPAFPSPHRFNRLGGSELWALKLRLPPRAMFEYRLGIQRGETRTEILDPLNPLTTTGPLGSNSLARGTRHTPPQWTEPTDGVSGSVSELRVSSDVWETRRRHRLYLPGRQGHESLPLVVVHDGVDFLEHSSLATVLHNLIRTEAIPPVAALLHQPRHRLVEYADDPRHVSHLFEEVIPRLESRLRLSGDVVLVGSSLGAVAALSAAWHRPEPVRGIGLLSGPFTRRVTEDRPAEIFAPVVRFVTKVDSDRRLSGIPVYMACGRYEGLIDLNRSLAPRLRAAGMDLRYEETWEDHQWTSWRDRLGPALVHALR